LSPGNPGPLGQLEISGTALEFCVQNHKFQVFRQKDGGQANSKQGLKLFFYSFVCYLFFRFRLRRIICILLFGISPFGDLFDI
jgi:hypothetical protein